MSPTASHVSKEIIFSKVTTSKVNIIIYYIYLFAKGDQLLQAAY